MPDRKTSLAKTAALDLAIAQGRLGGTRWRSPATRVLGKNRPVRMPGRLQVIPSLLRRAVVSAAKDRITTSAAGLAFHLFLAVLTAAVAAVGVIGLVGLTPNGLARLIHDLEVLVPAQLADTISTALRGTSRTSGGWVAALLGGAVALWSAVEAMAAMQVGLDIAYEVSRDVGFVVRRLKAVPLVLCTAVLGGGAFALLVLGNPIRSLLPASFPLARSAFAALWDLIRWVGALALVMILLSLFYRFGPNRAQSRRWFSLGALVATLGWAGASAAFSFYLSRFGHTSRTYGAFAGVAVLLLWLYLAATVILFGAEIDHQIELAGLTPSRAAESGAAPRPSPVAPTPGHPAPGSAVSEPATGPGPPDATVGPRPPP
jgi:membrane protein